MQGCIQSRPPWMGLTAGASRVLFETGAATAGGSRQLYFFSSLSSFFLY